MWPVPARRGSVASPSGRRTWSCSTCACPTSPAWRSTRQIRRIDARIPVIFVTMAKAADAAIEAMKQGAYDYLFKPLDLHQLRRVVGEALEVARRMREPAVIAETAAGPRRGRRHRRLLPGHARGLQGHRPRRRPGRAGADHRRERHRQGAGRPRHLPARPPGQGAVPGPQLRRHPGEPAGERAVRPREGRLHRRRPPPDRQVRAVQRRHPLPRRDRRHAAGLAGQDPARAAGAGVRARRRQRDDPDRRAADRGHPPRPEGLVGRGEVPAGPVLPAGRLHHPPAAAARAGRRPAAAGAALPAPVQPRAGPGGPARSPRRRWSGCAATPGRATSASCRAS